MKNLLPFLLFAILALPGCGSKTSDPAPVTPPTTPAGPQATYRLTNSGAVVTGSVNVNDYGDVRDNGGFMVSRAIIDLNLSVGGQPATARVKYYLSGSTPTPGSVTRITTKQYNEYDFNHIATGTLTGRLATVNGTQHLYLSGTAHGDFGPGYTALTVTFTDAQAY